MNEARESVRSLLLPLSGDAWLLPATLVVEVVPFSLPVPVIDLPEWVIGRVRWRDRALPLVCAEALAGVDALTRAGPSARIAVLRALLPGELGYYGLLIQGPPRVFQADARNLSPILEARPERYVRARTHVDGAPAAVPNLDALERALDPASTARAVTADPWS